MAESGNPKQPNQPKAQRAAITPPKKPLQVMHISKREEQELLKKEAEKARAAANAATEKANQLEAAIAASQHEEMLTAAPPNNSFKEISKQGKSFDSDEMQGISMDDLLKSNDRNEYNTQDSKQNNEPRSVDDYDFDEDEFLAALNEIEPINTTGEIAKGSVIGIESDGVYVDIGGKAPGFMPKAECGLGVITNFKEKFPKGLEVEVLVTREQNAEGIVTISIRALALRKSWDKVKELQKESKVVQVKVNGFNRGGVICDLEGLRGFIPRSQLEDGKNHEGLVGKSLGVAFLEVNPDTRKLVLSEKRATTAAHFAKLEIGQLVEGKVAAIKPYGFFIDLGGISGLLHQSMVTNGSLRSLREVFDIGDEVKALVTELDPARGRIGLNTALLEGPPGEIITDKEKIMTEVIDRAQKARSVILNQQEQSK